MENIMFIVFIVEVVFISSTLCRKPFEWCQYRFFAMPRNWNDADAICRQNNKTLAYISDVDEVGIISDFLENSVYEKTKVSSTFWIGMQKTRGSILLPDCNTTTLYSIPYSSSQLEETSRGDGCFYMDRNHHSLPREIENCILSRQFLCKAGTLDLNYRSCYMEKSLQYPVQLKEIDMGYSNKDRHDCDKTCERKRTCMAYKTTGYIYNFHCTFYHRHSPRHLRNVRFFVKDILDTNDYPEMTATKMCDKNSMHSELPSSIEHLTTVHELETSVPDYSVESYYSTPVLDYSLFPTTIITKPTTDNHVAYISASWITSVRSLVISKVGTLGPFVTYITNYSKIPLMSKLMINIICNNCANPSYKWIIQKLLNTTYVNVNYFGIQNSSTLHIPTNVMSPGENWNFHIDVTPMESEGKISKNIAMSVNELPYNGDCDISPRTTCTNYDTENLKFKVSAIPALLNPLYTFVLKVEVDGEKTNFTLSCSGWRDEGNRSQRNPQTDTEEGIRYEVFVVASTGEIIKPPIKTNAVSKSSTFTLPAGYVYNYSSCSIKLIVRVTDIQGDYVSLPFSIKIYDLRSNITTQILCDIEVNSTMDILMRWKELLSKWNSVELKNTTLTYIVHMQPKQWKNGVLDVIDCNNTYSYNQLEESIFQKAHDENLDLVTAAIEEFSEDMLTSLKLYGVTTMEDVGAAADAFSVVVNDSIRVTATTTKHVAEAYDILSNVFLRIVDNGSPASVQTVFSMIFLTSGLVNVISPDNLSDTYEDLITKDTKDSRKYVDFMAFVHKHKAYDLIECSQITPEERTGIFKLFAKVIRQQFKQRQILANECMDQLLTRHEVVISTFASEICVGCNYTFDSKFVHSFIIKNNLSAISDQPLSLGGLGLTVTISDEDDGQEMLIFVDIFDKNPYIKGESVTSSVLTSKILKVRSEAKGGNVHLDSVISTFPLTNEISGTFYPEYTPGDASKCIYHIFMYRSTGDNICLKISALQATDVTAYEMYIRREQYPTHLRFDYSSKVSRSNSWTTCLKPEFNTGVTYMCLRPILPTGNRLSKPQHRDSEPQSLASLTPYNLTIATGSCQIFDEKKGMWRPENKLCSMTWRASESTLQCICSNIDRELIIGNSFYVPANTISFSTVFLKFSLYNQASVLSVLVVTVVLYVVICVWARYQDRKDVVKWGVTPLVDNSVDDTYYYLITVHTGMRFGSGTNTPVEFEVVGSRKETGVRKLFDGVRKQFTRGSVMNFIMTTAHPLGDLDYIHIWLNPDEERPIEPWYLNRIDVEDLQQKQRYIFGCNKWLPDDSQSRSFEVFLPVYGKEDVQSFRNMFYYNIFENFAENHVIVSIFNRPTCSNFTRVQRATCLFVFVVMTMISNAIYFKPEDKYEDPEQLKLGPLILSMQTVYVSLISAAISTGTSLLVSALFRKSKPRPSKKRDSQWTHHGIFERFFSETRKLEKILISKGMVFTDGMIFPFWFIYVAWTLSICGSVTSMFFLLLYSMEWGKQKSEMWLTQFFMSFGETTVILDQIKIPIIAAIFAATYVNIRKFRPSAFSRLLILKNYKQKYMEHKDHTNRKRGPVLSIDARKKTLTELSNKRNFINSVRDLVLTCLFIWIVTTISYGNRDDNSFLIHDSISNYLVKPSNKIHFNKIRTITDFNTWLTETAFTAIFPDMGYYDEKLHWRWHQYFSDFYNFRVGPPRLRQLRVVKQIDVYPFLGRINYYGHYGFKEEAMEDYCIGWQASPCDLKTTVLSSNAWEYTSSSDIWGIPIAGMYNVYGGGGYIAELDVNHVMSKRIMAELTKNRWIDRHSRAVFLEFTLYSPTVNMLTHASFLAELPETGGIITSYTLYPFRIYQHHGRNGVVMLISEVAFLVVVIVLLVQVVSGICKQKCSYFKSVLKFLDCVIILTCLSSIGLYIARFIMALETMTKFTKQPKDYLNFQHLLAVDFLFVLVLSSLQALVTARFIGNLKFFKPVEKLFYVLGRCISDIGWFSVFFWYIILGFAFLGNHLFGRNLDSYMSLINTLETLTISILGKSNFKQIELTDTILAKFYFFSFIVVQVYFLLTVFFTILSESINAARNIKSFQSDKLIDTFKTYIKGIFNQKKVKEKDKPILPDTSISLLKEIQHCCHKELLKIQNLSRRTKLNGLTDNAPKTKQQKMKSNGNEQYAKKIATETV